MKKCFLILLLSVVYMIPAIGAESYTFKFPISTDDFEEPVSELSIGIGAFNTNLLSMVELVGGDIHVTTKPNTYGNSFITVNVSDNGYIASRTSLLPIAPEINQSNTTSGEFPQLTLTRETNQVLLSWDLVPTKFGYKVHKYLTNRIDTTKRSLVESVLTNRFVDTDVINGTTYYYIISWIAANATIDSTNSLTSSETFEIRVREPIEMRYFPPNGLAFLVLKNATYEVMYKTNILQSAWQLKKEVIGTRGELVTLVESNGFYLNNIIYVREKE